MEPPDSPHQAGTACSQVPSTAGQTTAAHTSRTCGLQTTLSRTQHHQQSSSRHQ